MLGKDTYPGREIAPSYRGNCENAVNGGSLLRIYSASISNTLFFKPVIVFSTMRKRLI